MLQMYCILNSHDTCLKNLWISFTVTKFLITTGLNPDGYQRTSEMIDLAIKSDSSCKNWAEFPKDVDSATGGVIKAVLDQRPNSTAVAEDLGPMATATVAEV